MKPILHTLEPHRLNHGLPDLIRRLAILTTVVVSLSACNRPTAPTVPMGEHSVSGVVSERTSSGSVPLEAVQIREEASGRYATTDSAGFYELSRLPGPSGVIIASKAGYATVRRTVAVNGDTRLDLEVRTIATQVLSGVVFETTARGRIAVEGVLVYCDSCGSPEGHTAVDTDAGGVYSFSWVDNGPLSLIIRKEGYELASAASPGPEKDSITVTVDGDTRFDIELVRRQ
ncbi:MAG TPA: hypothetical protein VFO14_16250 [Vicinamibacterales bacterium]|nr:hypothetical protein [Vicinamibacterales bacterium]